MNFYIAMYRDIEILGVTSVNGALVGKAVFTLFVEFAKPDGLRAIYGLKITPSCVGNTTL